MRTLHITRRFTELEWGGSEETIWHLCDGIQRLGHTAEVLTSKALDRCAEQTVRGVPVRRYSYFYPAFGLSKAARRQLDKKGGNLVAPRLLFDLLAAPGVDVLHAHTAKRTGGMVRAAARLRRVPYVVTLHGGALAVPQNERDELVAPLAGSWEWGKVLGAALSSRRVLPDADAVICISSEERRLLEKKYPETRVEHIPWGVNTAHFVGGDGTKWRASRSIPSGATLLVCVGRIDAQKNQLALVEALPQIRGRCGDVRVALVGPVTSPGYQTRIEQRCRQLEIEPWVSLVGGLPARSAELAGAYAAASCFVIPSRHEPFGVVVLEAWAAHRPVVAANVGGMADLVDDGRTGLLLPEPSGGAEIAQTLIPLLQSEAQLSRLADTGFEAVQAYSWDATIRRHVSLYNDVRRN